MTRDLQYLLDFHELREIIAKAARALDGRRFEDWLDLCTDDVVLIVPMDPTHPSVSKGKAAFRQQLDILNQFEATTHFTGNSVADIEGDRANVETYCIAHHLKRESHGRTNLRMSVRYRDSFVRVGGAWRMSKRDLAIDWTELCPAPEL